MEWKSCGLVSASEFVETLTDAEVDAVVGALFTLDATVVKTMGCNGCCCGKISLLKAWEMETTG